MGGGGRLRICRISRIMVWIKNIVCCNVMTKEKTMEKKLSKEQFIELLRTVKEATSVQGGHYSQIKVHENEKEITGYRDTTGESFSIDINKLYDAYKENERINTSVLKNYIDRVQSPGYAILLKMGVVNRM